MKHLRLLIGALTAACTLAVSAIQVFHEVNPKPKAPDAAAADGNPVAPRLDMIRPAPPAPPPSAPAPGLHDAPPIAKDPEEAEAQAAWQGRYDAGFRWAMDQKVTAGEKCPAKKGPFRSGCLEYVKVMAS